MIITYSVGFYCFDWPIALCLPVSEGLSAWPIHFNGTLTEVLCDIVPPSIPPRGLVRMMVGYRLGIDWRKVEPNGIKYPILTRYRPLFNPIISAREGLRSIQQPYRQYGKKRLLLAVLVLTLRLWNRVWPGQVCITYILIIVANYILLLIMNAIPIKY